MKRIPRIQTEVPGVAVTDIGVTNLGVLQKTSRNGKRNQSVQYVVGGVIGVAIPNIHLPIVRLESAYGFLVCQVLIPIRIRFRRRVSLYR